LISGAKTDQNTSAVFRVVYMIFKELSRFLWWQIRAKQIFTRKS
jgi:hypothetical protein